MKQTLLLLTIFIFHNASLSSQTPSLVEDYILGPQGSIDGRIYNFDNILTYEGTNQNGEKSILQYDKVTDEVTVLATNSDFDGDILNLASNTEEAIVFTGEGSMTQHIYRSFENDFSDLQKVYTSGESNIRGLRIYQGNTLILEENFVDGEYTTNIKVIDASNLETVLYYDLPGRPFDFDYTAAVDHFFIAPQSELIEGQSLLVYSIQSQSLVPITDVIPEFTECGILNSIGSALESVLYYNCDQSYVYDLVSGQYIDYDAGIFLVINSDLENLYITSGNRFLKINKETGQEEVLLDNIITSRASSTDYIVLYETNEGIDITYFDFDDQNSYTYSTNLPFGISYRLTGFGTVPKGVHFVLYESSEDNGVLARINSESFTEIDSVFNVSFNNRPVASDEDIYYTHEDKVVGNELFLIDYEVSGTQNNISAPTIKVSPNPASTYIKVDHPVGFIPSSTSIFDINGSHVIQSTNHQFIDIGDLSSGMYLLFVENANGESIIERFVVE